MKTTIVAVFVVIILLGVVAFGILNHTAKSFKNIGNMTISGFRLTEVDRHGIRHYLIIMYNSDADILYYYNRMGIGVVPWNETYLSH